jgi:hypothetical protein
MTIEQKLNTLAELIGGKSWGLKDYGKPRIYMPSSRDRVIYFEFPDSCGQPDDHEDGVRTLGRAKFRVFVDECGQTEKWYASQENIAIVRNYGPALAIQAFDYDPERAAGIMELDEITSEQAAAASHAFANGRPEEAWKALFGVAL